MILDNDEYSIPHLEVQRLMIVALLTLIMSRIPSELAFVKFKNIKAELDTDSFPHILLITFE